MWSADSFIWSADSFIWSVDSFIWSADSTSSTSPSTASISLLDLSWPTSVVDHFHRRPNCQLPASAGLIFVVDRRPASWRCTSLNLINRLPALICWSSFCATKTMIPSLGLVSLRYPKIRYALSVSFMPRRTKRDTRYPKIWYPLSVFSRWCSSDHQCPFPGLLITSVRSWRSLARLVTSALSLDFFLSSSLLRTKLLSLALVQSFSSYFFLALALVDG